MSDDLRAQLAAANQRIAYLENQLVAQRMAMNADYQDLRIATAKMCRAEIEQLDDALDALAHGKPHITVEFVTRSADTLRKTLASLKPRPRA